MKKTLSAALFPFCMAGAAFVCFILVFCLLTWDTIVPLYGQAMLFFLPAAVLFGIGLLTLRGHLGTMASAVLTLVLSVVFVFLAFWYLMFLGFSAAGSATADLRYYEKVYTMLEDRPGVHLFPDEAPTGEDVSFSYCPQILQGGEEFTLTFTPSDAEMAGYAEMLPANAQWSGTVTDFYETYHWSLSSQYGQNDMLYMFFWDDGYNHGEWCFALLGEDGTISFHYSRW